MSEKCYCADCGELGEHLDGVCAGCWQARAQRYEREWADMRVRMEIEKTAVQQQERRALRAERANREALGALAEAKGEREAVLAELQQAAMCLADQGDIDNPDLTQAGNQGLRHVHQALGAMGVDPGEEEQ